MSEDEKKDKKASFINEVIKDKPLSKKRMAVLIITVLALAVAFGLIAAVCFVQMKNFLSENADTEESFVSEGEPDTQDADDEDKTETLIIENVELDAASYESMTRELYKVGVAADKYIVTVTGASTDTDWFDEESSKNSHGCGVIFKIGKSIVFVVTPYSVVKGADDIFVEFADGSSVSGKLKGYDEQTGLCVVCVKVDDMSDSTMNEIDDANLSKNINFGRGTSVVAVGAPAGVNNSVVAGFVTSTENEISISDRNLKYFMTDIVSDGAGFCLLVNTGGDVLGIATDGVLENTGYLSVVYASQLYNLIDTIKEGKSVPYIGVRLTSGGGYGRIV